MLGKRTRSASTRFHLVLIKPSHYDDDGYPIQWVKAAIPSNTLACLNGLAEDARQRQVLGPAIDIVLHTYDETNQRVRPDRIIRRVRKEGARALIGLVGVQSNQFPRAVDLARQFVAADLPVCIGGFHVSGCIAMLPQMPPEMRAAQALGISFFAGEAEHGRLDQVMRGAWNGALQPLLQFHGQSSAVGRGATPFLSPRHSGGFRVRCRASIWGGAVLISARSARSSMSRAAKAGSAPPTTSSAQSGKTMHEASSASSSPTTISLVTVTGKPCSIG